MKKEQLLYDKFVDKLNNILDGEPSPKELEIVMNFLKNNNIQASITNKGLSNIADKVMKLPFDEEEMPLKRIK